MANLVRTRSGSPRTTLLPRLGLTAALLLAGGMSFGCDEKDDEEEFLERIEAEARAKASTRPQQPSPEEQMLARLQGQNAPEEGRYDAPPEMTIDPSKEYAAVIRTNLGEIAVDLFAEDAPVTVNNFVFLATEDFYDGIIFHRVIDDFMVQGGDPTGTGRGGPGYRFEDETEGNPNRHEPFTLSMANAGPDTNGSQFFITEAATPHLDGRHTVFGRVSDDEGREVVQKITSVETGPGDRPLEDVVIEDVVILVDGEPVNPATRPADEE